MIKTIIAICLILQGMTSQTCTVGCLKCNSLNQCQICDTTNGYYLNGNTCVVSTLTNCQVLSQSGSCLACASGYYLASTTQTCVAVVSASLVSNCMTYSSTQTCAACAKNFFIQSANCTAVTTLVANCNLYSANGVCASCSSGYIFNAQMTGCVATPSVSQCMAYTYLSCASCASGYIFNQNLYFNSLSMVPSLAGAIQSLTMTESDWTPLHVCQEITVSNCAQAINSSTCAVCSSGYFLTSSGTCQAFPLSVIQACVAYSSNTACSQCQAGYFLQSSTQCTLISGTALIANCISYDPTAPTVSCLQCAAAYYLASNTCTNLRVNSVNIANCQTVLVDADKCAACASGFALTTDGQACLAVVPNCQTYAASSKTTAALSCSVCNNLYYLNTVNSVTSCVSGGLTGCLTYNSATVCSICSNNYYLSGSNCVAHVSIPNCAVTHPTNMNQCDTCSTGYYPFLLNTICNSITVVSNCITYNSSGSCIACDTGYYLSGSSCINFSTGNPNCASYTAAAKCTSCNPGFLLYAGANNGVCVAAYDYMTANCFTLDSSVTAFPAGANGIVMPCEICNSNTMPVDLTWTQVCIANSYAIYKGLTVVPNCIRYSNTAPPNCMECAFGYIIPAYPLASGQTTCVAKTTSNFCATGFIPVLDNLDGFVNVCVATAAVTGAPAYAANMVTAAGTANTATPGCNLYTNVEMVASETTQSTAPTPNYKCISVTASTSFIPTIAFGTIVTLNSEIRSSVNGVSITAPTGLNNPYYITDNEPKPSSPYYLSYSIAPVALTGGVTNVETNKSFCEVYTLLADTAATLGTNYGCLRCKFGYSVLWDAPATKTSTTCTLISSCTTSTKYNGLDPWVSAVLSCHVCANTAGGVAQYPTVAITYDATNFLWLQLTPSDTVASVSCQTNTAATGTLAIHATITAPTGVIPNCLAYAALKTNAAGFAGLGSICIACKPGFVPTYSDNQATLASNSFAISACAAIVNCDLTKTQNLANRCTACANTVVGSTVTYYAFSGAHQQACVITNTQHCFSAGYGSDIVVNGVTLRACQYCNFGYWINADGVCEKLYIPKCSDPLSQSLGTAVISSFTYYLFRAQGFSLGCSSCNSGYISIRSPGNTNIFTTEVFTPDIQCLQSDYVAANTYTPGLGSATMYIANCDKYVSDIGQTATDSILASIYDKNLVFTCSKCKNNNIPLQNLSACVPSISNCDLAQNTATTLCHTCSNNYINVNGVCLAPAIANCKDYTDTINGNTMQCSSCNSGYYLSSDFTSCTAGLIVGCSVYQQNSALICTDCNSGFALVTTLNSGTYCFPIPSSSNCSGLDVTTTGLQGGNFLCNSCSISNSAAYITKTYSTLPNQSTLPQSLCVSLNLVANCAVYSDESSSVNGNSYFCTECNTGYYLNQNTLTCVARVNQPSACLTYSATSDTCISCNPSSTFLVTNGTMCLTFPDGILNCDTYSNTTVCTSCGGNNYLSNNTCLPTPAIANCDSYSANYTCSECDSGFFLNNSTSCVQATATNCYTYTSISACASCDPDNNNYGLQTNSNGVTNCVLKNVANCDVSTNQFPFTCITCNNGYYPTAAGVCQIATPISNCLNYDSATTCTHCDDEFVLTVDRTACTGNYTAFADANCESTNLQGTPACSMCSFGSFFVNGTCTSCSSNSYSSGCLSCNPNNQTQCLACIPGYYMNQNGACVAVKPIDNNNNTNGTSSALIANIFALVALLFSMLI